MGWGKLSIGGQYVFVPTCDDDGTKVIIDYEYAIRSVEGNDAVEITFSNNAGECVNVYWINYEGEELWKGEIPAGGTMGQVTYLTHAWTARPCDEEHFDNVNINFENYWIVAPWDDGTYVPISFDIEPMNLFLGDLSMDMGFHSSAKDSHKWQVHEDRQWNEEDWKKRRGQRKVVQVNTPGEPTYTTHTVVSEN